MKLIEIKNQSRRDFTWIYECENCKYRKINNWYDDDNFHMNVTPHWKCEKCWKSSKDLWITNIVRTKYESYEVV